MSRRNFALARESCRGHGTCKPLTANVRRASAILDASHYCLLLTLTRLRVNRMCLMKLLAPFIQEKVAYWIY